MASKELVEVTPDGRLRFHFHAGQIQAWDSTKQEILVLAGTQSGKTVLGPAWLWREIKQRGPGDYIVVTPTFQLLEKKALPAFRDLFEDLLQLGRYTGSPSRRFTFSQAGQQRIFGASGRRYRTQVFFGYATDPDSLESATGKAAWLDESGQKKFKQSSYQAIKRRMAVNQGRILHTTTPYYLGWLKTDVYDRSLAPPTSPIHSPDIDVIRFKSIMNPEFPQKAWDDAKRTLPKWKFDLFYEALFTKPAGLIYDNFDDGDVIPRFTIPRHWPRFIGLDFGLMNTAAVFYANEPGTKRLYLYRTYHGGGFSAAKQVESILSGEPRIPFCVGGSKSEKNWRQEFRAAGLPVREPDIKLVEVGIDRVYEAHADHEILVFDDQTEYLDQKRSYSRKLDDRDEPTEEIEDKETYHYLDGERYVIGYLKRKFSKAQAITLDLYAGQQQKNAIIPARSDEEIDRLLREQENHG